MRKKRQQGSSVTSIMEEDESLDLLNDSKDNESLDNALQRFKKQCAKYGVLAEIKKREHYEKPGCMEKTKKAPIKTQIVSAETYLPIGQTPNLYSEY